MHIITIDTFIFMQNSYVRQGYRASHSIRICVYSGVSQAMRKFRLIMQHMNTATPSVRFFVNLITNGTQIHVSSRNTEYSEYMYMESTP